MNLENHVAHMKICEYGIKMYQMNWIFLGGSKVNFGPVDFSASVCVLLEGSGEEGFDRLGSGFVHADIT